MRDNGREFILKALDPRAYEDGVALDFSRLDKPTNKAFVESFNGRLQNECLITHWFRSLDYPPIKIQAWRREYDDSRPHPLPGWMTPDEYGAGAAKMAVECTPETQPWIRNRGPSVSPPQLSADGAQVIHTCDMVPCSTRRVSDGAHNTGQP